MDTAPAATDRDALADRLRGVARNLRITDLEMIIEAGSGHPGGTLSAADMVAALFFHKLRLRPEEPWWPERDRFVLSKGHAALALYAALELTGRLPEGSVGTYCGEETMLGVHPEHALAGVDFSTGSLGQGLSMGVGAALAARLQGSPRRVFVLVSDAECNEGAVWEAIMFAAHHRLANLVAIVDLNGQQALGFTDEVLSLSPLADRWRAFGWDVHEVDGHDAPGLARTVTGLETSNGAPHVLIARTVFGKGVSYMERQIKWHYLPMSDDEYRQALQEVGAAE